MPDAAFDLTGLGPLASRLQLLANEARQEGEWWVGTSVEYGPYHEFGTSVMPARPHWRTALALLARDWWAHVAGLEALAKPGQSLVARLALHLERLVKIQITRLHIIDTGNYRGSIAAAPTQDGVLNKSDAKRIDR